MNGGAESDSVWQRGLAWTEAQRRHFALPRPFDPDDLFPLKVLAELVRIADVIGRSPRLAAEERTRLDRLLAFAWEEVAEGGLLAEVLRARPFLVLGSLYATFERHGRVHEETRAHLARLSRPGAVTARQLAAPRRASLDAPAPFGGDGVAVLGLDLALAWRRLGLASPWSQERLFPLTRLSRRPPVDALSEPEAYSLTHVVFFTTDFGSRPAALDDACRSYLGQRCPAWMEQFRSRSNLDLYSELAAVLGCVGAPVPDEVEQVLRLSQADDGSVPGPGFRSRRRLEATSDPSRRLFLECYHTTLAAALASFAATAGLSREADPPRPLQGRATS